MPGYGSNLLADVLAGHTDREIAERRGAEVGPASSEIATVLERIIDPAPEHDEHAVQAPTAKHRRD